MAVLIVAAVLAMLAALTVRAEAGPRGGDPAARGGEPGRHDPQPARDAVGEHRVDTSMVGEAGAIAGPRDDDEEAAEALDGACDDCDVATLSRLGARGPSVGAVVAATQRAAGVEAGVDPTPSWRRRSRWSSLVPWITVRAGN
ncbi:MAG TPA: hypothetical protein VLB44_26375, partial [Kofleriaceae bacterium]|nr:hypothetical protein [Kofleriaceae bacterium]